MYINLFRYRASKLLSLASQDIANITKVGIAFIVRVAISNNVGVVYIYRAAIIGLIY